jgi:hypothetical protein
MKSIHYRNIGYPKTGTTWLYYQLLYHPNVDGKVFLHEKEFVAKSEIEYKEKYQNYDVSFNLDTHLFQNYNNLFYSTHLSCIFRNIYQLLNTWYNYIKNTNMNIKMDQKTYLSLDNPNIQMFTNTKKLFNDWEGHNVKFLFYDDLERDNKEFMYSICDFLNIPRYHDPRIKVKFKTKITEQLVYEDKEIISCINEAISIIEDNTHRDLTHWKK